MNSPSSGNVITWTSLHVCSRSLPLTLPCEQNFDISTEISDRPKDDCNVWVSTTKVLLRSIWQYQGLILFNMQFSGPFVYQLRRDEPEKRFLLRLFLKEHLLLYRVQESLQTAAKCK